MDPLVTVIVPVYNGQRYIVKALESVFSQQYGNLEVIVVNDGSTDGSEAAIEPYRHRLLYIKQPNLGIAAAYNAGLARSSGPYISFLEQDDFWLDGKLRCQVAFLVDHAEVGMVYSRHYISDADGRFTAESTSELALSGQCFADLFEAKMEGSRILPFSAVMLRRTILEKVAPLDQRLKVSVDFSTWLRVAYCTPIGFLPEPAFVYRVHPGNSSKNSVQACHDDLMVLQEWAAKPECVRKLGKRAVRKRILRAVDELLWLYRHNGDSAAIRSLLLLAARIQPLSFLAWSRYCSSMLGWNAQDRLTWYTRRIGALFGASSSHRPSKE